MSSYLQKNTPYYPTLQVHCFGEQCSIALASGAKSQAYYFHYSQLPAGLRSPCKLWTTNNQAMILTARQGMEAGYIFGKINQEKNSDYIFSKELLHTYLVELFHFIMKIHQGNNPVISQHAGI